MLCCERLTRILRILARHPKGISVRDMVRTFGVLASEVEQAAELGWLAIETRKPHTGRPTRIARTVSIQKPAKLPPSKKHMLKEKHMPKEISIRHRHFALLSVYTVNGFRPPVQAVAYQRAFPDAQSHTGAAVSASRLIRHNKDVRAAREWFYSRLCREVPAEPMPTTREGIIQRLRDYGSWRVNSGRL